MALCMKDVNISEKRLQELADFAMGWAALNGMSVRPGCGDEKGTAVFAPFALFPSVVPGEIMKEAKSTMPYFNTLMHRAAMDHDFLTECFQTLIEVDNFTAQLWNIYIKIREAGTKQPIMLGLFRNDFMMDCKEDILPGLVARADQLQLKQIEFNTMAAAGGGIIEQLGKQHRLTLDICGREHTENEMPENKPSSNFASALVQAWRLYGNQRSVIVMVVNDAERFATDQQWIEVRVAEQSPQVRVLRRTFTDLHTQASLDSEGRLLVDGHEVGLVYIRHGYAPEHYPTNMEWNLRLMLEMSRAIKCPSIQHHLVTSKIVQQRLAQPGALERFIKDPNVVDRLRATFVDQYSLDLCPEGDKAVELALDFPDKFVLKPSREGGGNNLFDEEMTEFLTKHGQARERSSYVLMQRIFPWQQKNYLCRSGSSLLYSDVVTEIGIYGVFIGSADEELENYECGYLMKTKVAGVTDGGILAGYASMDTPFLC